jgi:hypothetical protein
MTTKEIEADGSGKDGAIVWWEPERLPIGDLTNALKAIGRESLLPKSSVAKSALREALAALVAKSGLRVRGNTPSYFPLAPEVVGWEARRLNRGSEQNQPEFILSVVADNGIITIPKYNPDLIPQLDAKKDKAESALQSVFDARSKVFPTEAVSACISRVIASLGGILVRQTGGVYFVPPHAIERYEEFCKQIDSASGSKPEMVNCRFALKPTERSFQAVLKAVKEQAVSRLAAVEEELAHLGSKKQRANGKETRLNEVLDVRAMLTQYQEILGVELKEYESMADAVASAISIHSALEFCA